MPHVLPLVDGPVYGTPLTLALVEPKLEEHGLDGRELIAGAAARPRDRRAVRDRVHPRHAQHARLRRARHPHAGRRRRPHRRLQDRSDADRRRALRRAPLRGARQRGRAGAVCRQHQHRSPRLHRIGARGRRRVRGDLHERARQADRRGVRVEHLPHADPRRSGGAVRSQGRVRRPRHDAELRDRAAARLPAHSRRRADSRLGGRQLSGAGRAVPVDRHRRASRCRRCRASRSTITAT